MQNRSKAMIHRLISLPAALLYALCILVACTSPSYPSGIDNPSAITDIDRAVIEYIDQRLEEEYYWLDEVQRRGGSFNRNVEWKRYLSASLSMLKTNGDDGYVNSKGGRVLYSYIQDLGSSSRAGSQVNGFGIELHFTIVKVGEEALGFVVENVYPDSPAARGGVRRGDVIISIDGKNITQNNYQTLFNSIHLNKASSLQLLLHRQYAESEQERSHAVTLQRGSYYATPIAYCDVIDVEGVDKRIGYLVYTSFDSGYNDELKAALAELLAEGVDELILDLRSNGGGSVTSATLLCSSILGPSYEGELLFELRRNPKNKSDNRTTQCLVEATEASLALERITVICSNYSASASEMVVVGLRGVDIPVTLIGCRTEGKNCGMDVTRRNIGSLYLEYAPITFMCYNAVGFGDYGEGLEPDVELRAENSFGVSDEYYPLPRCEWGDMSHDIGLAVAVASVTGKKISQGAASRAECDMTLSDSGVYMERPLCGARLYEDEK